MTGLSDRWTTFLNKHLGSPSGSPSPGTGNQPHADRRGSSQLSAQQYTEGWLARYSAWYEERQFWADTSTNDLIEEVGRRAEADSNWETDDYTQRAISELEWRMRMAEQQAQEHSKELELQEELRKEEAVRVRKAKIMARVERARAAGKARTARDEIVLLRDRIEELEEELEALRDQIGSASDQSERYDSPDDLRPPTNW